ncbi:MAG: hypothetical protein WBE32_24080, partial [Pseudolabrys sp.]
MLNLVCQLVRDAFLNAFDVSVIVTNDTDQSKLCAAKQERRLACCHPLSSSSASPRTPVLW